MGGRDGGLTFAMAVSEAASPRRNGLQPVATRCAMFLCVHDQYGWSSKNVLMYSAVRASIRLELLSAM